MTIDAGLAEIHKNPPPKNTKYCPGGYLQIDTRTYTLYYTYYCAESLSWYSRARLKHSWIPESDHRRIMAESSSAEKGSVSSIRLTTSHTILASAWRKHRRGCFVSGPRRSQSHQHSNGHQHNRKKHNHHRCVLIVRGCFFMYSHYNKQQLDPNLVQFSV